MTKWNDFQKCTWIQICIHVDGLMLALVFTATLIRAMENLRRGSSRKWTCKLWWLIDSVSPERSKVRSGCSVWLYQCRQPDLLFKNMTHGCRRNEKSDQITMESFLAWTLTDGATGRQLRSRSLKKQQPSRFTSQCGLRWCCVPSQLKVRAVLHSEHFPLSEDKQAKWNQLLWIFSFQGDRRKAGRASYSTVVMRENTEPKYDQRVQIASGTDTRPHCSTQSVLTSLQHDSVSPEATF